MSDDRSQEALNMVSTDPAVVKIKPVCNIWVRIVAIIFDLVILGVFGYIIGTFLFDFFARHGVWRRLVGFGITLVYFGALNSYLGNGQTIGNRLTLIKVVDSSNSYISIPRSILRITVLSVPFFLNGLNVTWSSTLNLYNFIASLVVVGGIVAIVYLYIFNKSTRQSLHDVVTGTFVVRSYYEV